MKRSRINDREIKESIKKAERLENELSKARKKEEELDKFKEKIENTEKEIKDRVNEIDKAIVPYEKGKKSPHQKMTRRDIKELKEKRKELKRKINNIDSIKKRL